MAELSKQWGRTFTGKNLSEIAFPLGGIGTGTIALGGRGNLQDWEIFDHPQKGHAPPFTFSALWARAGDAPPASRILERRLFPPYNGWMGIPQVQLPGVTRFDEVTFKGAYPFAWLEFTDADMPVEVNLEAFNPFIPHNVDDSSIPVAIFNWTVTNPGVDTVEIALATSLSNMIVAGDENGNHSYKGSLNEYRCSDGLQGVVFSNPEASPGDSTTGTMALSTSWSDVAVQTRWYRGGWWDACHLFWDQFSRDGRIEQVTDAEPAPVNRPDVGTILLRAAIAPGESVTLPVFLTWHFPIMNNPWQPPSAASDSRSTLKKRVAVRFKDAWDAAVCTVSNYQRLRDESLGWHETVWNSTVPHEVLDAITSQVSTVRSQTCFQLACGSFFGWEGCRDNHGSCHGNCTHVWNYEQALAFLFPELERSMRQTEFLYNTRPTGHMGFRTYLPPGSEISQFKPCADGQMGTIIQAYRDWQLSGDDGFLKEIWPKVKLALEYAWTMTPEKAERYDSLWDPDKNGVMEGEQHNTYDIEFFGPNTMTTAMYLGALKACEQIARHFGETEKADEYHSLYERGRAWVDEHLWNGEYYMQEVQVIDDVEIPDRLKTPSDSAMPKYQYGEGCLSDQLLGQLSAHIAGLGYILDPEHVKQAVKSIFKHNFRDSLADFDNVQRVFALNDEAGLLLCSWPHGNRPALPFVYSDEVWTGIEYQVAAHLIYEGWVDEGLKIVEAVRQRYAGHNRNPWDEIECGHHYARGMASWGVLLALSGFSYSVPAGKLGFAPRINRDRFQTFWSTATAWGRYTQILSGESTEFEVQVTRGQMRLNELELKDLQGTQVVASMDNTPVSARVDGNIIVFEAPLSLSTGQLLRIQVT